MKKLIIIFSLLLIGLVSYGQPGTQKIRNKLRIMDDFTVDGVSYLNGNIQLVNSGTITNDDADIMTLTEPTIAFIGRITALKTTEQFRLLYDADNYLSVTLLDDGHTTFVTVDPDGEEADINFAPDGNVGIKTAAPSTALEVTGTTTSTTFLAGDGAVGTPSFSLTSDLNTGIYTTGEDVFNISVGGVIAVSFIENTTTQALFAGGISTAPSISFIGNANTGIWNRLSNRITFSNNGAQKWEMSSSDFMSFVTGGPSMVGSGASSTVPTFLPDRGDANTGIGQAGDDLLSLISGGKEGIRIDGVLGGVEVIIKDTLTIEALATADTEVLSPDANGVVVTLATADIGDIAIDHSGGMVWVSTSGTQTIGTGGTFERLNEGAIAYTANHLHDFTHSDGRLTYTGTATKHFCVAVFPNIESHEASAKVQIRIALNGTTIAGTNQAHDYRATDTDAVIPTKWLLELSTNDYIELFGTSDTSSDTFELLSGALIISEH